MSMTEDKINIMAGEYLEAICQQFRDPKDLLQFLTATTGIALSVIEALSDKAYLDQFVADATGPNRMQTEVVMGRVQ